MLVAVPADALPMPVLPAGFSIALLGRAEPFRIVRPCAGGEPGEILVCGRRDDTGYALQPLPPSGIAPPDAGLPVGIDLAPNLRAGLIVDQVTFPDGRVSRRLMVALRSRF